MPIPKRTLARWSHHQASPAFTQAHLPIRAALDDYKWPSDINYEVFLQGSYKNDTNLGGDNDVDVVVRMNQRLRPRVAEPSGKQLQEDASHQGTYRRWKSFRDHALKAMRDGFGDTVKSGRKTLKVPKGKIHADADLVVTLPYREGIAFYLADERRWVVDVQGTCPANCSAEMSNAYSAMVSDAGCGGRLVGGLSASMYLLTVCL